MSSPTSVRDMVVRIASSDPERARALAQSIDDAWFRCQALSAAAYHQSRRSARQRMLDAAIDAANHVGDPNRVVTVSAWPIKVLAAHGESDRLESEVDRLLNLIATEPSPVRRADALKYLFGAVVCARPRVTRRVTEALVSACLAPLHGRRRNRRGESLLIECLPAIARIDPRLASDVLAQLPDARATSAREHMRAMQSIPLDQLAPWPNLGGR